MDDDSSGIHARAKGSWARGVGLAALLVGVGVLAAAALSFDGALSDETAAELADRVAEQARDEHIDSLLRVNDGTDPDSARSRLLLSIEAPEGVDEVQVNRKQRRASAWDNLSEESVSRAVVVVPDEGEPFCAVVGISSEREYRGVPAQGDVEERCRNATHQESDVQDPLIGGWAGPQR